MTPRAPTLAELRRFAVGRSLIARSTLPAALARLGFVQADPIRAPARAQDLILRPRVSGYRAGELERRYESLPIEEDFFINYGFVTRVLQALMHPRSFPGTRSTVAAREKENLLMTFIRERAEVHPREAEAWFTHGTVRNYWGGRSHATTKMMDHLHYRGLLRVSRREKGIRLYRQHQHEGVTLDPALRRARIDALVDVIVNLYAPLPALSLSYYVRRLAQATPQWKREIGSALSRARERLAHARVAGSDWYWPNEDKWQGTKVRDEVTLLAPFDPIVHDRKRFELFWGWAFRFEAYTPLAKRKLGYYALPLLWREQVIGWANAGVTANMLRLDCHYLAGQPPRERTFRQALREEEERFKAFLGLSKSGKLATKSYP